MQANAAEHAKAICAAKARLLVFPELSLTGYELEAEPVSPADDLLAPIVKACAATGSVALVGAPVLGAHGDLHIGMLRVDPSGVEVACHKNWLGPAETGRFKPGAGPRAMDVDGWRVGLGICKDTGVAEHVSAISALGIDLYIAGLAFRPEERAEHDARATSIARRCKAHVVFASFAGPTGGGYDRTAGFSAVWSPTGTVLARATAETGVIARASIGRRPTRHNRLVQTPVRPGRSSSVAEMGHRLR